MESVQTQQEQQAESTGQTEESRHAVANPLVEEEEDDDEEEVIRVKEPKKELEPIGEGVQMDFGAEESKKGKNDEEDEMNSAYAKIQKMSI